MQPCLLSSETVPALSLVDLRFPGDTFTTRHQLSYHNNIFIIPVFPTACHKRHFF